MFKSFSENLLHNSENFMGSLLVWGHTSISKSIIINNIHAMALRFVQSVIIRLILLRFRSKRVKTHFTNNQIIKKLILLHIITWSWTVLLCSTYKLSCPGKHPSVKAHAHFRSTL